MKRLLILISVLFLVLMTGIAQADYIGTIGTKFIIEGSGFGTKKPQVYLEYEKQPSQMKQAKAKVQKYNDTSLTCLWTQKLAPGTYNLFVKPSTKGASPISAGTFSIIKPIIDEVTPKNLTIGAIVTINGQFFTNKKPKVFIENLLSLKRKSCKVLSCMMNPETGVSSLHFVVPKWSLNNDRIILQSLVGESSPSPNPLSVSTTTQPQVGSITTVKGVFKDSSGNSLPSKAISVKNVLYNQTDTITTDANGNFEFTTTSIPMPIPMLYLISDGTIPYVTMITPLSDVTVDDLTAAIVNKISTKNQQAEASSTPVKQKMTKSAASNSAVQVYPINIGVYSHSLTSYSLSQLRDPKVLQNLTDADMTALYGQLDMSYWTTFQDRTISSSDKEVILTLQDSNFRDRLDSAIQNVRKYDIFDNVLDTVFYGGCAIAGGGSGIGAAIGGVCFGFAMDSAWNTYEAFIYQMCQSGRWDKKTCDAYSNGVDNAKVGLAGLDLITGSSNLILIGPDGLADLFASGYSFYADGQEMGDYLSHSDISTQSQFSVPQPQGTNISYDYTACEPFKTTQIGDMTVWDRVPTYFPIMTTISASAQAGYAISGTVASGGSGLGDVSLTLTTSTGALVAVTITDSNGNYKFKVPNTGGYIITPSKKGYIFAPTNIATNVTTDVAGQDFIGYENGDQNDLVAYWSFDACDARDYSGNNHEGTLVSVDASQCVPGVKGKAFNFSKKEDHIEVPHDEAFNLKDEYTISFWVNIDAASWGWQGIDGGFLISKEIAFDHSGWTVTAAPGPAYPDNYKIRFIVWPPAQDLYYFSNTLLTKYTPYHIAIVGSKSANKLRIYINGILDAEFNFPGITPSNNHPLWMSAHNGLSDRQFDGILDEVRIYDRALSGEEIKTLSSL